MNVCDSDCGVREIADGGKRRDARGSVDGGRGYINTAESRSNHDDGGYT